jgi:Golgi phosphoprotein 3
MLTVLEEFLLLTLKDNGGDFVSTPVYVEECAIVGAVLMDLALHDRVDSDTKGVWLVSSAPTENATLNAMLARLVEAGVTPKTPIVVADLIGTSNGLRQIALDSLCQSRILEQVEGRLFWFLKARRYPVIDGKDIREAKLRLLSILLKDEVPEPRDVCLLALAKECDLITQFVPKSELKRAEDRMATIARMDLIGQNVARQIGLVRQVMTAIMPIP